MKTEQEIMQMVSTCNNYYGCGACPYNPKDLSMYIGDKWKGGCPNYDRKLVYAMGKGYGDVSEYKAEIERLRQEVMDTDKMARNTIEQYRAENEELENALKQSEDNYSRAYERLKAQGREIGKLKDENEALKNDLINSEGNLNHITTEIEQLKEKCEELRNEKWDAQDDLDCYCDEMPNKIKQSKIDVLNELKKYLHTEDFDTPDERWKPESEFCAIIDKLIKEVNNAEDKG